MYLQSVQFYVLCIILIWVAYFLPYFILGENSTILIHDNLDSNVIWTRILINSGQFFSLPSSPIEQVFNGIPRSSLYANYDISLVWFKLFGTYWGYVFNKIMISLIGGFGMYFLLKKHFIPSSASPSIIIGIALIFSLLPFWSFTPSIAGLPFVLFSFLNFRNRVNNWYDWIILLIFPFYSSLVLSGFFIICVLGLIFVYDIIKTKSVNYLYLSGLLFFSVMYVMSHALVFYSFLFKPDYTSLRVDFKSHTKSLSFSLSQVWKIFIKGRYDSESLHKYMLIPIIISIVIMYFRSKINKAFIFILLFIVATSIFYGLHEWSLYAPINDRIMDFLPIKLKRFHWLHPMFWYILIAISFYVIEKSSRYGIYAVQLAIIFQVLFVLKHHELLVNRRNPTFKQFFAKEQFDQIKVFIGKSQSTYRVISLGIHPSISQYNGFYTLDGYFVDYPLEYKLKFREIIVNEIERDKSLKDGFDNWGSRCYAFSSEIGQKDLYLFDIKKKYQVEKLDFDFSKLKELGGEYIISKAIINEEKNPKIKFMKSFIHKNSFWTIYLYQIT